MISEILFSPFNLSACITAAGGLWFSLRAIQETGEDIEYAKKGLSLRMEQGLFITLLPLLCCIIPGVNICVILGSIIFLKQHQVDV